MAAQTGADKPSGGNLGELYATCVQMVNENKISTKNAWSLQLIEHMDDIVDSFMGGQKSKQKQKDDKAEKGRKSQGGQGKAPARTSSGTTEQEVEEHRFHEASCTIEASARIYAVRVDCVHTDTYRVLGGLNSADMEEAEGKDGEEGGPAKKKRRIIGVNTLEKNEKNITQSSIEADEQSDPMFRRMAAAFDAGGAKGLLLSHLPLAEDLSLVFNGDVPIVRAAANAKPMFEKKDPLPSYELGMGVPEAVSDKLAGAQLCPEVDGFRRELLGSGGSEMIFPAALEALLGAAAMATGFSSSSRAPAPMVPLQDGAVDDVAAGFADDGGAADMGMDGGMEDSFMGASGAGVPQSFAPGDSGEGVAVGHAPIMDAETGAPAPVEQQLVRPNEEAIAFDELFDKFWNGGSAQQFAYFDECWSKAPADKKGAKDAGHALGPAVLQDGAQFAPDGQLVPAEAPAAGAGPGGKPLKRPLFDLTNLERPVRPIEMEPSNKHQLSERAAQWQLHKDVPPYMIDRITMPSWPTWSKCDFACLGLRPHLMLKLVRKPQPPGDGPHSFSDLFSTVVVENPDAFPLLSSNNADDEGDTRRVAGDDEDDEDFDANGIPVHMDVNPNDLFLRADDNVIPGCGEQDFAANLDGLDGDLAGDMGDLDFAIVEQQNTVSDAGISYSRNSKFVDVKLVKKNLWENINDDITGLKHNGKEQTESSFQQLIKRTMRKMPRSECENLSAQVCFICALHLCNEKGLELKTDPENFLGDFQVVGPWPYSTPNK
eukprot:TRINITY_DN12751_c0_g1_i1.p1 TRINITY_DN12751_c0_g1~~TRINITY_DN12751_c0_g1_i1.p1  ORF type:complete len:769 (+),score=268.08 TRINITY_DN12751_c0_g1_i1:109-2415(+)